MDVDALREMRTPELEQAATLFARRRAAEAIAVLRTLLAEDPHDLDALDLLGEAQLADHDPDGALATATTALGLDPKRDLSHRQASIAASRRGLHRDAVTHADEAIRLAPDDHRGFVGSHGPCCAPSATWSRRGELPSGRSSSPPTKPSRTSCSAWCPGPRERTRRRGGIPPRAAARPGQHGRSQRAGSPQAQTRRAGPSGDARGEPRRLRACRERGRRHRRSA